MKHTHHVQGSLQSSDDIIEGIKFMLKEILHKTPKDILKPAGINLEGEVDVITLLEFAKASGLDIQFRMEYTPGVMVHLPETHTTAIDPVAKDSKPSQGSTLPF